VRLNVLALTVVASVGLVLGGCGRSSNSASTPPANTAVNPGPNPTTGDPGPNNTANGPETLQGTLSYHARCVQLVGHAANQPTTKFQLAFVAETVKPQAANVVLTGPDGRRVVGPHDIVYLTGHPGSGSGPCGPVFTVDKVVGVTPG
jgi:hypothetical protein